MALRSKFVFVTPAEFEQWVREEAAALGAVIILEQRSTLDLKEWDGTSEALFRAFRIYFAEERSDLTHLNANDVAPGQLGWFQVDVPVVKGPYLIEIQLGVKSAWDDWDNPGVIKFFDRFWRRWRKHFKSSLIARCVDNGKEVLYKNFWYSPGAAKWVEQGNFLCDHTSTNVHYYPAPEQCE